VPQCTRGTAQTTTDTGTVLVAAGRVHNGVTFCFPARGTCVARYRVTLRVSSIEVVDADNPYQAAVTASNRHGADVEIADV